MLKERGVEERSGDPSAGLDRTQCADEWLRELQPVRHVEIERRVDAGTEIVEQQKTGDDPEMAGFQGLDEAAETVLQPREGNGAPLFIDEQEAAGNHQQGRKS